MLVEREERVLVDEESRGLLKQGRQSNANERSRGAKILHTFCFRLLFLSSSPHATASGTGHPFSDEAVLNTESVEYLDVLVETLAERKFSAAQVVIDASFAEMLEGLEVLVAFRVVAVGAPPAVAGFTVPVVHAPRAGHHEALWLNISIA